MLLTCTNIALALLPTFVSVAPQQVWTVDPAGTVTQIQQAVTFASDGDVILVKPGTYAAFSVENKSLTIQGEPGANVSNLVVFGLGFLGPAVQVKNLRGDQAVVIRNLAVDQRYFEPVPACLVVANAGSVLFEDCTFDMASGPAVTAWVSSSVSFVRCVLRSGTAFQESGSSQFFLNAGLKVIGSNVHLFECALVGNKGTDAHFFSTATSPGGPGLEIERGFVFAQGCNIVGGVGGGGSTFGGPVCGFCQDGGPGLLVNEVLGASRIVLLDCDVSGGAGAQPLHGCPEPPGQTGPDQVVIAGQVEVLPGQSRTFGWSPLVSPGEEIDLLFVGEPGDLLFLLVSAGPGYGVYFEPLQVVPHIDLSAFVVFAPGTLGAAGHLFTHLATPALGPGEPALTFTAQALFVEPSGDLFMSGPSHLTVVNGSL